MKEYGKILIDKFTFPGNWGHEAWCQLEIIATERRDNPGTSVTNAAERLAGEICRMYRIDPLTLVWIEHYGYPDAFGTPAYPKDRPHSLVSFTTDGRTFRDPQWRVMSASDWEAMGLEPRSQAVEVSGGRI